MKYECDLCGMKADWKEKDEDRFRYYCEDCTNELIHEHLEKIEDDN